MSVTGKSGGTRDIILDATDDLLTTSGFRKVTMEDIAARAGVSRRTIYMYFPSKVEVGLSSIDRVVESTYQHIARIAGAEGDPAELLHRMLVERILYRVDSVRAYRTSLDELFEAVRPAYMARRRKAHEREAALVTEALERGRAAGRFSFDDARATAETLIRATNAFLPYSLSVQELAERERIEEGVRRMADLLLKSLTAGETRPPRGESATGRRRKKS